MPKLDDPLHLDMYAAYSRPRARIAGLLTRLARAIGGVAGGAGVYGYEWGDPDTWPPLMHLRDHYLRPWVGPEATVVEIGPGGGRWTRYALGCRLLYAVDYHPELLAELARNFTRPNVRFVHNAGTDFPGVPDGAVDFLFSFGTFVHLDLDLIEAYLGNMRRVLKPGANVVLQYADQTKVLARSNPGFADNDPARMGALLARSGYRILEEDRTSLWHSSVVRFTPGA